ncbi:uncharacterized protein SPAPADRAFT_59950 [Spathaspora passalidarum NRRL Y-27907]|uniref:Uncharacterized protein n=1 Tax=Spathaspora passalidarum (strain NRRL Y-27907 / 11-Y1) TaxID=619300 RepID=G3AJ06_SPAPN|nr:uncharacterized protein SPAPADRAFT_59950 [Spathaspora passalidarum NRRL Y-27907]EGW34518.1 hypothetical protein SPAPADRAFT_59950 [Spathaspora passalidarum NRRL Y-27907]
MSSYLSILEEEITHVQELLQSLPFNAEKRTIPFLEVYKIPYHEFIELKNHPNKFPIDGNKLLKLGISLGNLLKTLEAEKENYDRQQTQQQVFIQNLNKSRANKPKPTTATANGQEFDPFKESSDSNDNSQIKRQSGTSDVSSNANAAIHPYQIRFMMNLLNILKSFDIRVPNPYKPETTSVVSHLYGDGPTKRDSLPSNYSPANRTPPRPRPSSASSEISRPDSVVTSSPIKLSSRQLSIEKLEININVDNIFIYKILLKMIREIYLRLKEHFQTIESQGIVTDTISKNDSDENFSIFSSNSNNSQENLLPGNDEYLRVFHQVMSRISYGILEPFILMIYHELAEKKIQDSFTDLIESL